MKIYQIHETGGWFEENYDLIVGSYLSVEKANEECERLQEEEKSRIKQAIKCNECPLYNYYVVNKEIIKKTKKYCSNYAPGNDYLCSNSEHNMDESHFEVREEEVIE